MTDPRDPDARTQRPQGGPAPGKKALGKGLGALIGESRAALGRSGAAPALQEGRLRELPLADISVNRRQPRRTFADDELQELAASIKALGVVQPVVVRPLHEAPAAEGAPAPAGVRFELIAGERRLRAAKLAGLEYIPALVRPADEISSLEIALAENVAREDLNAIEEALAYAALADEFGLTHERIAELVGRSRVSVTNLLRLLDLPDDVQALIESGDIAEGHGRALLGARRPRRAPPRRPPGRVGGAHRAPGRGAGAQAAGGAGGGRACGAAGRRSGLRRPRRRALRRVRGAREDPQRQARRLHPDRASRTTPSCGGCSSSCAHSAESPAGAAPPPALSRLDSRQPGRAARARQRMPLVSGVSVTPGVGVGIRARESWRPASG